jgi:hypothetical protein
VNPGDLFGNGTARAETERRDRNPGNESGAGKDRSEMTIHVEVLSVVTSVLVTGQEHHDIVSLHFFVKKSGRVAT